MEKESKLFVGQTDTYIVKCVNKNKLAKLSFVQQANSYKQEQYSIWLFVKSILYFKMLFSSYNMLKEQITFSMLPKKKKQNRHQLNEKPK